MRYFHYRSDNISGKIFYFFTFGRDGKEGTGVFSCEEKDFEATLKALEKMNYENRS